MPARRGGETIALAEWKHAAVQEVHLQSGAGTVKQRPGTLAQAIRGGRVPNPLLGIAVKVEYEGVEPAKLDPQELADYEAFRDWYIAETVIEPAITPEDVADLPSGDREQLWLNAIHMFDARLSEILRSLAEARSFRDGPRGAQASGDGEGSRGEAE